MRAGLTVVGVARVQDRSSPVAIIATPPRHTAKENRERSEPSGRDGGSFHRVQVIDHLGHWRSASPALAAAIGEFDGVHIGHRTVLATLVQIAAAKGWLPTVVVLLPVEHGRGSSNAPRLTSLDQRLGLLEELGVERVYLRHLTASSTEIPEATYRRVLTEELRPRLVVHGAPHRLSGNAPTGAAVRSWGAHSAAALRNLGATCGFDVVEVPRVLCTTSAQPVSAPAVADALARVDLAAARQMLGRDHCVSGEVLRGDERGRRLGFPTANLDPRGLALPGDGVFAGTAARQDGARHAVLISLGRRPTFSSERAPRQLEVHLLDFDGLLYGEHLAVSFARWIRPQRRFPSEEALAAQISQDAAAARSALGLPGG